jgi:hypothetical protein
MNSVPSPAAQRAVIESRVNSVPSPVETEIEVTEWTTVERHHSSRGKTCPRQDPDPVPIHNYFDALNLDDTTESNSPSTFIPTWAHNTGSRNKVWRVISEMKSWYEHENKYCWEPEVSKELCDDAENFKQHLMHLLPLDPSHFLGVISLAPAFWNRVALHRLRFQGKGSSSRRLYVVVRSLSECHRLLVLHVPPTDFPSETERWKHASQQATYNDDEHGRFARGLRVSDSILDWLTPGEEQEWGELYVQGGYPMTFVDTPKQYRKENYSTYTNSAHAHPDLLRQLEGGWIEGPLLYVPWIVNRQGGIYKPETDKWRTFHDCAASGLNDTLQVPYSQFDGLPEVLPKHQTGSLQSGFDFKDAFFSWPRRQEHCDYLGLQDVHGNYYRYRFANFGCADSPYVQSRWSAIIKRLLNTHGLRHCPEALQGKATCAGIYVDDGHVLHDPGLLQHEAETQFQSHLRVLHDLGIEDSEKKREHPKLAKLFTGFLINNETNTVTISEERKKKYAQRIKDLLDLHRADGRVLRREHAEVIGKLQWLAPVVRGGQGKLSQLYFMLDGFELGPSGDEWGKDCFVHLDETAIQAYEHWVEVLKSPCSRRFYPNKDPAQAGFWKGVVPDTHDEMDETSYTRSGIPVLTGDASGDQAGLFFGDAQRIYSFPDKECTPHKSSNFRELKTPLLGLREFASQWNGQRVLYRSDNTTTVSIINRQGTMARDLLPVSDELVQICDDEDIDLAAAHIPGDRNTRSDWLSRHKRGKDFSDWAIRDDLFYSYQDRVPHVFTIDGAADELGTNSKLPRFCSKLRPFCETDFRGEHVWCNPDFDLIFEMLVHFLACQKEAPSTTSGTFVLPVWTNKLWWHLLRQARILDSIAPRSNVFTSPDWRTLEKPDGSYEFGGPRVARGATNWPVVVVHFPAVVPDRGEQRQPDLHRSSGPGGGRRAVGALPTLQGRPRQDAALLYALSHVSL